MSNIPKKTHKLTPEQRAQLCERYRKGEMARDLACAYGLTESTVRGLLWRRGITRKELHTIQHAERLNQHREQWEAQTDVPYGYCQCGCGERTPLWTRHSNKRGYVAGAPVRYLQGHSNWRYSHTYKVQNRGHDTACWIWQGPSTRLGYASTSVNGTNVFAHREYYKEVYGPIPEGKVLDHLCCVPLCVRPSHLEAVTQLENVRRGKVTKLSEANVGDIRALYSAGMHHREIAETFGIGSSYALQIAKGQRRG